MGEEADLENALHVFELVEDSHNPKDAYQPQHVEPCEKNKYRKGKVERTIQPQHVEPCQHREKN